MANNTKEGTDAGGGCYELSRVTGAENDGRSVGVCRSLRCLWISCFICGAQAISVH